MACPSDLTQRTDHMPQIQQLNKQKQLPTFQQTNSYLYNYFNNFEKTCTIKIASDNASNVSYVFCREVHENCTKFRERIFAKFMEGLTMLICDDVCK